MANVRKRITAAGTKRWDVRYRDANQEHHTKSFDRQADAVKFAATVETDLARGEWVSPALARKPFSFWADQWLGTIQSLKPKTREGYESILHHHLMPRLGNTPISRFDLPMVSGFVADLTTDGLGAGTVRNVRAVLSYVVDQARLSGAIRTNPVADTKAPRHAPAEMLFLTPDQIMAVAHEVANPPPPIRYGREQQPRPHPEYGMLVRLAGFTGLRSGELLALRKNAVDIARGRVHVLEAVTEAYGQVQFVPPKNWRRRSVPMPGALVEEMHAHLEDRAATDLVFASKRGTPLRPSNFRSRHFKPAAERAGVPEGVRFHDLRHSYAAMLIAQGAHPKAMMERLGHSTIQTTLDTYGHLFPELESGITDQLDDIYRQIRRRQPPGERSLER